MLVVANRIPVADGYEEAFVELFESRTGEIRHRAGFEGVELLRPVEAGCYVIQAYWESRDAFEQWRTSDEFEDAHAGLPDELFDGPNQLEVYERVATVN